MYSHNWTLACDCNVNGSIGISCGNSTGQCSCKANIEGTTCDHCKDRFYDFPTCQPCNCHVNGSNGLDCNDDGICICKTNVDGNKCDKCQNGYQGHPLCDECQPSFFGYPTCQGK